MLLCTCWSELSLQTQRWGLAQNAASTTAVHLLLCLLLHVVGMHAMPSVEHTRHAQRKRTMNCRRRASQRKALSCGSLKAGSSRAGEK